MNFDLIAERANQAAQWVAENPRNTAAYATAGTLLLVPAVVAAPALAAAGFGASGPVAASLAASTQAGIGNVAAGSVFATLQSAGMGGYGLAVVNGVIQGGGAATAIGAALKSRFSKTNESSKSSSFDELECSLNDVFKSHDDSRGSVENGMCMAEFRGIAEQWWGSIPLDKLKELSESLPTEAINKAKGWSNGY
ncbi:uncharacterized protein F4822DRAFT_268934 [Hypoxylon trugodes]|uniref:uncharacterized protein n=1 Tax=Hypoxylon trugodes TaxID=326681 RepID=UPI0021A0B250|nr:uncharacterized protein F4822DRAFT_268934 [Hypoxylon trugodes]KAI1389089.1 hypothetical protein F4822DRAFT_268934 [Hypoxylon trugodes]